ncbi:MAG: hypothetical protein HC903_17605 [Methylacidiphilales bacterium]|nr:hypothetical protein [Candidatus Methylacidiphilales bacterium]NJR15732.1 hypothetical protein [Calothrix sp. CSU_2_0]
MVTEYGESAESQAPGAWTTQKACERSNYGRQLRGIGQNSREFRGESITPGRDDWTGGSFSCQSINSPPGKIVEQLIEDTKKELESTEVHANKLRERLNTLQGLSNQLPAKDS